MEARVRAIEDNNIELLKSGLLDDPMLGKKCARKWRDGKISEKSKAFEKLYKSLENDVTKKKRLESNDQKPLEIEGGKNDEDEDNSCNVKSRETQDGTTTKENERAEETDSKDISINKELEIAKINTSNSTNGEKVIMTTKTNLSTVIKYPKNNSGKKLILPNHATQEELLPPTQPVEGTLDTSAWRKDMPQEIVDDIESIFRDPKEMAQKEAIFNKINKDYITVQAQKEKNRSDAEKEKDQSAADLAEQTQGMERYRKRKFRLNNGSTTEESLLQVVANRKISRKINYDAMSSIFDDGSFSTEGALEDPFDAAQNLNIEEV